jgi:hypothetical protein
LEAAAQRRQCRAELEAYRADGHATGLVNAPSFQLQNGRAEVPDFLPLSDSFGKCYEATSDKSQTRPDEGS